MPSSPLSRRPASGVVVAAGAAVLAAAAVVADRTVLRRRYGATTLARLGRATTVLTVRPGGHAR